jgi:aminoacrylate hydrolase
MPFAPIDAGELHYETTGSGAPVLLAAGLSGLGKFWSGQVEALAHRFMVIRYDHRGNGRSTRSAPPYSIDGMVDDVIALLDHLRLPRVRFVGHSTGGAIGQRLAAAFPDRVERLVLSATWTHCDPYFRRLFSLRRDLLARGAGDLYARLSTLLLYAPSWIVEHDTQFADEGATPEDVAILIAKIDALLAFDSRAVLPRIVAPTLVISARDDMIVPLHFTEVLLAGIRHAKLEVLDSGGHYYPITRAERFTRLIEAFLVADQNATQPAVASRQQRA